MSKIFRILLLSTIIVFVLLTLAMICVGIYLLSYKDSHVDSDLLYLNFGSSTAEFYYFEATDKGRGLDSARLIEDAVLSNGVKYKFISYREMPQNLINAFVSVEDKRFFKHRGIDYFRLSKAVLNYVFGKGDFGGSTITQQLVKNLTGHAEFDVTRKIREAFCAVNIEKEYGKEEIIEMYLNVINLSGGCRGVGAAAEFYFSKPASQLTLSECAMLAAITNNPLKYDPRYHPENTLMRRNTVLKCMLEQEYIDANEYEEAIADPIQLNLCNKYNEDKINSWYIDMVTEDVIDDLCEKYDIDRFSASSLLYRGNLKIYTAMDADIQKILDEYYSNIYNFPIDDNGIIPQSAMIIIDPHSGDVLGVAGGVGEKKGNRLQNYATQVKRPPGSTIKPLSVYAPAIDKGLIDWATIVDDSPISLANGKSWPQNVTRTYRGPVDIRYALGHSLNTVAVKVLQMVGEENSFDFLNNDLLIHSLKRESDMGLASLGLGQVTNGISLRELTGAYSIFDSGIMSKTRSYYKVTDQYGRVLLDNQPEQKRVISCETAAIMTKLLETVVDRGTVAGKVSLDDKISVAGKSGTSQNNFDRLFVGYTPELLAGVWFGYDYPKDLSVFGGNLSVYIWNEVMSQICENTLYNKTKSFFVPSTLQKLSYDCQSGVFADDEISAENMDEGWFNVKENHIFQ